MRDAAPVHKAQLAVADSHALNAVTQAQYNSDGQTCAGLSATPLFPTVLQPVFSVRASNDPIEVANDLTRCTTKFGPTAKTYRASGIGLLIVRALCLPGTLCMLLIPPLNRRPVFLSWRSCSSSFGRGTTLTCRSRNSRCCPSGRWAPGFPSRRRGSCHRHRRSAMLLVAMPRSSL